MLNSTVFPKLEEEQHVSNSKMGQLWYGLPSQFETELEDTFPDPSALTEVDKMRG